MKSQLSILLFVLFSINVNSQSIPNPGFEDWTSGPGYNDPNGWGTINSLVASILPGGTALRATNTNEVHTGLSALKLLTKNISTYVAPGICATGTINTDGTISGGIAYNQRPTSLSGWYMYNPVNTDTGSVEVTLSKWNGTQREVIGHTIIKFTINSTSYQQFSDSIEYYSSENPDTAVFVLISSAGANGYEGSTLFLDDLQFVFNNTGVQNQSGLLKLGIGPNPAENALQIFNLKAEGTIELFDVTGRKVGAFQVNENKHDVNISNLNNGTYIYRISDRKDNMITTGKLVIKR